MKLKVILETHKAPKDNFHMLESITELKNTPKSEAWDLIKQLYNDEDPVKRVLGIYLNAVITENKLTHLLSGKQISQLLAEQTIVKPNKMNNKRASSIFASFIESGYIEEIRPVIEGKKAGVVKVNIDEITDYVNARIGAEVSKQYEQSVVDFYDGKSKGPYPGPLEKSTSMSTTITNTYTNTVREEQLAEPSALKPTVLAEKSNTTRPSLTRQSGTDTANDSSSMVDRTDVASLALSFEAPKAESLPNPITKRVQTELPKVALKGFNEEHAELLQSCLSIPADKLSTFDQRFLSDKAEKLERFGSFSDKQVIILKKIASKAIPTTESAKTPVKPTITPTLLHEIAKSNRSPAEKIAELQSYDLTPALKPDEDYGCSKLMTYIYLYAKQGTIEIIKAVCDESVPERMMRRLELISR